MHKLHVQSMPFEIVVACEPCGARETYDQTPTGRLASAAFGRAHRDDRGVNVRLSR